MWVITCVTITRSTRIKTISKQYDHKLEMYRIYTENNKVLKPKIKCESNRLDSSIYFIKDIFIVPNTYLAISLIDCISKQCSSSMRKIK